MSLRSEIEFLRRVRFFEGLSDEHLRLIAFSAEPELMSEGEILFEEGGRLQSAYVVAEGRLVGTRGGENGFRRVIEAGALIGEMALIVKTTAQETVRAETDGKLLQIRHSQFKRLLQEYPEAARVLRTRIARRVVLTAREYDRIAVRFAEA